jgi:hypothetical protein
VAAERVALRHETRQMSAGYRRLDPEYGASRRDGGEAAAQGILSTAV